jgi:mannose-1-phosphate guanylyltransferase
MQALILVGGEGTRLRPLTSTMPKPIVPLVDRPFMAFMLEWLARHGVDDVIMSCGFLATQMRDVLGDGSAYGVKLRFVEEPEPRGTAGALKYAEEFLQDRFLMLNGDVLSDMDLSAQIAEHERNGARATLALVGVADPSPYGLVRQNDDDSVREFVEKPTPDQIDTNFISAGAYVLERDIVEMIPPDRSVSIEREIWPELVGDGLFAYRHEAYWLDIGKPYTSHPPTYYIVGGGVETSVSAPGGITVGAGCSIAADAEIGPLSVLGNGVVVGAGSRIERSVVLDGTTIGVGCTVSDSIVGPRVAIGDGTTLCEHAVIGEAVTLGADNVLARGIRIFPGVAIGDGAIKF